MWFQKVEIITIKDALKVSWQEWCVVLSTYKTYTLDIWLILFILLPALPHSTPKTGRYYCQAKEITFFLCWEDKLNGLTSDLILILLQWVFKHLLKKKKKAHLHLTTSIPVSLFFLSWNLTWFSLACVGDLKALKIVQRLWSCLISCFLLNCS